ncbi:MAG: GNAT family N-acetyltransferase, partial [Planctomycetes bacterium]|nr:GNAT family N-acetyltransferase [Planctomycetota bacterium]
AESWEEFLSGLSRNRREKLRRYLRDLKKHDLEFHEVTSEQELEPAWQALMDLHQLRWSQSGEPGCFASAHLTAFHTEVVPELFRRGLLSLSLLKCGERPVAASYCLRHRGVVSFYQGGVDPAWWECRPGHILRTCELRRAIERGDRVYDLLGGDMEYKSQWGTPAVTTLEFLAAGPGPWADCQFGLALAGRWIKQQARTRLSSAMWSRLRRWKQRRLAAVGSSGPAQSDGPGTKDRGQVVPSELAGV